MTLPLLILRAVGLLVPACRRADWLAEWGAELWYVSERGDREALSFCLGAFPDAFWLRRNHRGANTRQRLWLQSPLRCLLLLAGVAAASVTFFFHPGGPFDKLLDDFQGRPQFIFAHSLMMAIALVVLPATTPLALGEYPVTPHSPARARRFRRWIFLGLKFTLILAIVFCGTLDLGQVLSSKGIQPTWIGYVLAFRWALIDQRRRCPVCLRLLANPTSIGQPAHTFLEWYGTELFCVKGHGLLHVPEIPTTYSTQRWLDLDPSWSGLFS